ncbi:MAG: hypothetical protein NVV73_00775 [Cellvibrionaceae bacterium]|nr:hypothetical protein [Cellvibrionaceae bacterium]
MPTEVNETESKAAKEIIIPNIDSCLGIAVLLGDHSWVAGHVVQVKQGQDYTLAVIKANVTEIKNNMFRLINGKTTKKVYCFGNTLWQDGSLGEDHVAAINFSGLPVQFESFEEASDVHLKGDAIIIKNGKSKSITKTIIIYKPERTCTIL